MYTYTPIPAPGNFWTPTEFCVIPSYIFYCRKKYNNDDKKVLFLAVSDDNKWIKVMRQEALIIGDLTPCELFRPTWATIPT